jgi:polyketide cyclase/dehydrase/lipid transport protein
MRLQSWILVGRAIDHIWAFFVDLPNLATWDRSVAQVIVTSSEPLGVGSTFETIAPSPRSDPQRAGARLSYRITEVVPQQRFSVLLVDSPMFKRAVWTFVLEPVADGARITCLLDFALRPRYSWLLPILLVTSRGALRRDLTALKQALEQRASA